MFYVHGGVGVDCASQGTLNEDDEADEVGDDDYSLYFKTNTLN